MNPKDIYDITSNFNQPVVLKNIIKWKLLTWNLKDWCNILKEEKLVFRKIPFINSKEPLWENQCQSIHLTLSEFIKFQNNDATQVDNDSYSLYFDYKYMKDYFKMFPEILQEVRWSEVGYPEVSGYESTIWIGSQGSHTLCHQDCYGYNLIAQIYGHKEWILFSPDLNLCPTRVPFEESTVFSKLNLFCPNIKSFEGIKNCRRIVLEPGDVLFLPHGWWHYVENLDTAISINTWLPVDIDHKKRIEEGLISIFIQGLIKNYSSTNNIKIDFLLNSNHEFLSEENAEILLNFIQQAILQYKNANIKGNTKLLKYNCEETINNNTNVQIVPILTEDDFHNLLIEKLKRYKFTDAVKSDSFKENSLFLENIVNSFCNPDNISRIANDFINKNISE